MDDEVNELSVDMKKTVLKSDMTSDFSPLSYNRLFIFSRLYVSYLFTYGQYLPHR